MSDSLHILPSTDDVASLAQIRSLAQQTATQQTCLCLSDPGLSSSQIQNWFGPHVVLHTVQSRSPLMHCVKLYQLARRMKIGQQHALCWNPARFPASALPMLKLLDSFDSMITTPSKRELAYPGMTGHTVLKNSKQIFVSSDYLRTAHFPDSTVLSPIVAAPAPCQPDWNLRQQLGLSPSTTVMLSMGRLDSSCRLKEAVWITGILENLHQEIHLVLCGQGAQRRTLEQYRDQMLLRPRIHFTPPWCNHASLMQQADCLLVTADHSGRDWAILQAIQYELPVVASRSDGNEECVVHEQTGFIGGPSAGGLAKFIHQLMIQSDLLPPKRKESAENELIGQWAAVLNR